MSDLDNFPNTGKQKISKKSHISDGLFSSIPRDSEKGFPLLHISEHYHRFDDLIVADKTRDRLENIISENRSSKKLLS